MKRVIRILILFFFAYFQSIKITAQATNAERIEAVNDIQQNDADKIVLLTPYEAITYINNYREKFNKKNNLKHTRSIFLTSTYFNIIKKFFEDSVNQNKYDGVRVLFASYHKYYDTLHTHQVHPKQITIILAPTIEKVAQLDVLNQYAKDKGINRALNHGELCPNSCDIATGGNGSLVTNNTPSVLPDPYIFLDSVEAKKYIHNYRKRYTKLGNKKHSKSLWMPKKNFLFLGDFFKADTANKFGGIRLFFASYNKYIPETNNARKKQITLVFTATNKEKEPDFNALINFYCLTYGCTKNMVSQQSENHGELCPNACDDDGF